MKTRLLIAAAGLLAPVAASALTFPTFPSADLVLGQVDFTSSSTATPPSPRMLDQPIGVAIDPATGKVFVADTNANRVLRYENFASLQSQAGAEAVFGQVNFSSEAAATTQTGMINPAQLCIDGLGRLWVADFGNNRVLMFHNAATRSSTPAADLVLGQPDFTTATANSTTAKMAGPIGVWLGVDDTLWVSEFNNNRVLRFDAVSTKSSGASADGVLGQTNFITTSGGLTSSQYFFPTGIFADAEGRLWVADGFNGRVLRYDDAASLPNGAAASAVLGQPDFTTVNIEPDASTVFPEVAGVIGDAAGNLFVVDSGTERVLLFRNAAGKANGAPADAVLGQPDFTTATSGTTARKLNMSFGSPALDPTGALWLPDRLNNRVLRFSPITTPPTLAFTSKLPKQTKKARLTLRGTSASEAGIASVEVLVGRGTFKPATGTTSWRFKAKLVDGRNRILVRAADEDGRASTLRAVVKRK